MGVVGIVQEGLPGISGSRVTHHKRNHSNCLRPLVENAGKVFPVELRLTSALVCWLGPWNFPRLPLGRRMS